MDPSLRKMSVSGGEGGCITAEEIERAKAQGRLIRSPRNRPLGRESNENVAIFANISKVLDSRSGSVLDSRSILKVDFVPDVATAFKRGTGVAGAGAGAHQLRLYPIKVKGALNLRRSPTTGIFGTAQPSIAGIRGILNLLGAGRLRRPRGLSGGGGGGGCENDGPAGVRTSVLWINLREEPTLYVNGRSTVLRERDEPFHNINQLQGMDPMRIHLLERRLKEDVLDESNMYGGNVVLHEEVRRDELEASWEGVALDDVLSPEEAFFTFSMRGYRVKYVRIPTTPEKAPSADFFDGVVGSLMDAGAPRSTVVVFNCQNGISRSTIGMVAGGLVQMWRGLIDVPGAVRTTTTTAAAHRGAGDERDRDRKGSGGNSAPAAHVLSGAALTSVEESLDMQSEADPGAAPRGGGEDGMNDDDALSRRLRAGWYRPTLALIRLLDSYGLSSKRHVDYFCEDASQLVDLRRHIFAQWLRASRERHGPTGLLKVRRAATALLRYMLLMSFDAYLARQVALLRKEGGVGDDGVDSGSSSVGQAGKTGIGGRSATVGGGAFRETFREWLHARPEIVNLLSSVEEEPLKAMEVFGLQDGSGVGGPPPPSLVGLRHDMADAMRMRRGSMLAADTILKADHFPVGTAEKVSIKGAPNFRMVENTRVYGVCTPTCGAAADIVRYVQAGRARRVAWTNLREEPVVYINGEPFVLRSVSQPFRNASDFVQIHPDRLEAAERRLKLDILTEAKRCGGRILVHTETDHRTLQLVWVDVAVEEDVVTPRELFESLSDAGLPIDYARVPLTPEQPPSVVDVGCIIERVRGRSCHPGTHFVFNCQLGRGRSTTAMAIALLELQRSDAGEADISEDSLDYLGSLHNRLSGEERKGSTAGGLGVADGSGYHPPDDDDDDDTDEEPFSLDGPTRETENETIPRVPSESAFDFSDTSGPDVSSPTQERGKAIPTSGEDEFGSLLSLVRVLRDGVLAKMWADSVVARCGEVENIRRNISDYIERANTSRTTERGEEFIERALLNLKRFFVLILVAAYEIGYDPSSPESYGKWYERHPEIQTIYNEVKGKEALRYASVDKVLSGPPPTEQNELADAKSSTDGSNDGLDTTQSSIAQFVARRNGMVLMRGSIIKSDHFPGCNRLKGAAVAIDGVPNFREIRASGEVDNDIGIFGTGIPTVEGLRQVLEYVSQRRRGRGSVVWVNLREEPILYVNGKPYVLRKLEHPFENLEHTGISRERVESMEDRLKVDVINEILANGCRLLVHDEDESGIKPIWLSVDISEGSTSVQTPRDLYSMLAIDYDVTQYRVPITDEQAPKITDYDEISNIVRNVPIDAEIVFNCQMGRGRTTTGLVIASAVRLWEHSDLRGFSTRFEQLVNAGDIKSRRKIGGDGLDATAEKYLRGGYDAIGALTRVLDQGVGAKATTDAVIDACDSLQNLREAIFSMKEASESEDKSRVQRIAALNRGIHYLRRYYQLITFVAYLFCYSPEDRTRLKTFTAWLDEHRELMSIMKRGTLD